MGCVSAKFVSKLLSVDLKENWVSAAQDLDYAKEGKNFLKRVITGDELWL